MSPTGAMRVWQLHPEARLRRTGSGGGAIFLPATAATVELDAEAFAAIALLGSPHNARSLRRALVPKCQRNFTLAEIDILLCKLAEQNVLVERGSEEVAWPHSDHHVPASAAPESVHLQLNNTCNLRCPSCYVDLRPEEGDLLPLERIEALIEEWARMGVFQLALGGAEPLLSPLLVPVMQLARQHSLVPNVTTNGWLISESLLDAVQDSLGEMRLSLNDAVSVNLPLLGAKAGLMRARGLRFGWNLIVTHRNLNRLAGLLAWGCAQGAATINLIRPKPAPGNTQWYQENALTATDAARLLAVLKEVQPLFTKTALSVDCALSFLFHGQPARELQARGVAGCAMGERFVTVKWNGDVYPCSHLRGEQFKAGNVRMESFQNIWERSEVFTGLRRDLARVKGHCGGCSHKVFCKGCRAVMWQQTRDWLAADAGCPVVA